jgi:serine/threonine-protein kinase
MSFFEELKRRNVIRMAVLYGIASWLILQIADVLFDQLGVPGWAFRLVLGLLVLGFPLALIFSWVFELTPEGIKREREIDRGQSITHETGRKINVTIIVLLVLAIAGLIADRLVPERATDSPPAAGEISGAESASGPATPSPAPAENELSIAVLPFVNMSGDPENEYFSDGLSEELLNTLVQISELKVTGRTSSFAFKGQNVDLREVGEQLNVANVLEGSVRKANNRVRITAQLVKTNDGYHLWSETFDRDLDDIFAIQAEIAEKVAQALSVTLLGRDKQAAGETHNAEAYQAYLRGQHAYQGSPDDPAALAIARKFFEQAIALDPAYVAPWFGMFNYWDRINRNGIEAFGVSAANMRAQAEKLEQLAPSSVEALLAKAQITLLDHDWRRTLALHKEARDRFPGKVEAYFRYGNAVAATGHLQEGLAIIEAGILLDPLSVEALTRVSFIAGQMGNCSEVQRIAERVLEISPDIGRVRGYMGYCLLQRGDEAEEALTWLAQEPIEFIRHTGTAVALHRMGRREEAARELALFQENSGDASAFQYAQIHAQWGESGQALDWLQKALDTKDPGALNMGIDHFLDPVRQQPRFQDLLQQAGLADCCELPQ